MKAWDSEQRAFAVGSGEISMSLLDVALILGVPVEGDPVVLTEEESFSGFEELYGAARGKRKVVMGSLEVRLDSIGDVVSDDFVRTSKYPTVGAMVSYMLSSRCEFNQFIFPLNYKNLFFRSKSTNLKSEFKPQTHKNKTTQKIVGSVHFHHQEKPFVLISLKKRSYNNWGFLISSFS